MGVRCIASGRELAKNLQSPAKKIQFRVKINISLIPDVCVGV